MMTLSSIHHRQPLIIIVADVICVVYLLLCLMSWISCDFTEVSVSVLARQSPATARVAVGEGRVEKGRRLRKAV